MNVCGSGIMHMEGVLLAAYVGCKSCFNRSDRCIYRPEQGNCLPIFGAFSILLHVHCARLGRSIIIALNGDVQPRIKAPFPFQNMLSRPWPVKISLTNGTSCWIHLVKPWICGLSFILHCRKNGPSE